MTAQEAIEKLKYIKYIGNGEQEYKKCSESIAIDMAIESLEKQIPKKPIGISKVRDNEGYIGLIGKCPCCDEILEEDTVYCDCGQKLDWGE